jgi:transcriptional regulator with XRE-family HTH domain
MNSKKLKAALVEAGYNQRDFAAAVQMSKNTLNAKLNGKSPITIDEALLFSEKLNLTKVNFEQIFLL